MGRTKRRIGWNGVPASSAQPRRKWGADQGTAPALIAEPVTSTQPVVTFFSGEVLSPDPRAEGPDAVHASINTMNSDTRLHPRRMGSGTMSMA